jgi:hypothetical protein
MGWDEIERSWNELRGEVKRQWSKLTDEDVELMIGLGGSRHIAPPSSRSFAMTSQV